ncbi:hypothetical protein F4780DRAFT_719476 [Xylariomycetidae sp. FL0641]|nr:hypothetical protein F4780DRAFT_719476 [Xylariomycetidae sp. FL0641]
MSLIEVEFSYQTFLDYVETYKTRVASLPEKLDEIDRLLRNAAGHNDIKKAQSELDSVERELDAASEDLGAVKSGLINVSENKQQAKSIKRNLDNDFNDLKTRHKKLAALAAGDGKRSAALGKRSTTHDQPYRDNPNATSSDQAFEQRNQLRGGTESLERQNERISRIKALSSETEGIGSSISSDLVAQRERIQHTQHTLYESEGYVDRSVKTLRGMSRRMATNRIITIAIITVLVILIMFVIWAKLR